MAGGGPGRTDGGPGRTDGGPGDGGGEFGDGTVDAGTTDDGAADAHGDASDGVDYWTPTDDEGGADDGSGPDGPDPESGGPGSADGGDGRTAPTPSTTLFTAGFLPLSRSYLGAVAVPLGAVALWAVLYWLTATVAGAAPFPLPPADGGAAGTSAASGAAGTGGAGAGGVGTGSATGARSGAGAGAGTDWGFPWLAYGAVVGLVTTVYAVAAVECGYGSLFGTLTLPWVLPMAIAWPAVPGESLDAVLAAPAASAVGLAPVLFTAVGVRWWLHRVRPPGRRRVVWDRQRWPLDWPLLSASRRERFALIPYVGGGRRVVVAAVHGLALGVVVPVVLFPALAVLVVLDVAVGTSLVDALLAPGPVAVALWAVCYAYAHAAAPVWWYLRTAGGG